jgi:hypothetical protein
MKIKLITAAVVLAAAGNASAAILSPIETNGGGGGLSEAVFSIWDPTTSQSYAIDLGTTWQVFRDNLSNASYTVSYDIDTSAGSVYDMAVGGSNTANLLWNVSVANGQNGDYSNFEDFGVIGTSNLGNDINSAALTVAINAHDMYATALRGTTSPVNNDPSINDEYFGTVANGAYAGNTGLWGTSWATNGATNNAAAYGTDLDFYYFQTGGFSPDPIVTKAAGSWSFDGAALTYGAPSAVPVPAAAWLFGSGLLGLVGIARRKRVQD